MLARHTTGSEAVVLPLLSAVLQQCCVPPTASVNKARSCACTEATLSQPRWYHSDLRQLLQYVSADNLRTMGSSLIFLALSARVMYHH